MKPAKCPSCFRAFWQSGDPECNGCERGQFQVGDVVKRIITPGETPLRRDYKGAIVVAVRDDGYFQVEGFDDWYEPHRFTLIGSTAE